MREIKFRALYKILSNNQTKWAYFGLNGKPSLCGAIWITEPDEYTGLKDKNGREIYEGDILKGDGIFEVIFLDSTWCVKSEEWTFAFSDCAITTCEVIGNIHENPELLEAK